MLGFKTVGSIYDKIKNLFKEGILFIAKLPLWIPKKLIEGRSHIVLMKHKLKNFYQTNLDLGLYHLRQGNINDAIMRFKIIDIFILKNDSETNYWLGWCYFLKNNYSQALSCLKKAEVRKASSLINFIENHDKIDEVPSDIHKIQSELMISRELLQEGNYVTNLPKEFVSELLDAVEELPKECAILDLGCSGGFVGKIIDDKLQKNYHLTGVEAREPLIANLKKLRDDKRKVYDDLKHETVKNFLNINSDKYNIIISFNSLNFAKNLESYFRKINASLKSGGYFALLLPLSDNDGWSAAKNQFIYKNQEVGRQLKLAEFNILSIREWKLNRLNNYIAFISKK